MDTKESQEADDWIFEKLSPVRDNLEACWFLARYCSRKLRTFNYPKLNQDFAGMLVADHIFQRVAEGIVSSFSEKKAQESFLNTMLTEADDAGISDNEFHWLWDDGRAAYWFWQTVRMMRIEYIPAVLEYQGHQHFNQIQFNPVTVTLAIPADLTLVTKREIANIYLETLQSDHPSSVLERAELVSKFFSKWQISGLEKRVLFNMLKEHYKKNYDSGLSKWLSIEQSEQCLWTWEYISKQRTSTFAHPIYEAFPRNAEECYYESLLAYDLWQAPHIEVKKRYLDKLTRAWNQKRFRESNNEKKPLNTYISTESKDKLKRIAKEKQLPIYQVIEYMISKEFDTLR